MLPRLFALLLIGIAALIGIETFLPEESHKKITWILLSAEQKAIFAKCEDARNSLRQQGLPNRYVSVDFMVRDDRLKTDPILKDLQKCFPTSPKSSASFRLEVEVFSSDFGQESSADLQVQVSAFEVKSGNKVAEVGFRLDHEPLPSKEGSSRGPLPQKPTPERAAEAETTK